MENYLSMREWGNEFCGFSEFLELSVGFARSAKLQWEFFKSCV